MTVYVYSFDFDGCLANEEYQSNGGDIIKANQNLLNKIKNTSRNVNDTVMTLIGSDRQSHEMDLINQNTNHTASCFTEIKKVADEIGSEFDPFLLSDIYGVIDNEGQNGDPLPQGTSFARAVNPDNQESHGRWRSDQGKLTLLYAQINKISKQFPDEKIVFNFYNAKPEILDKLKKYIGNDRGILPLDVRLELIPYTGSTMQHIATIEGTGETDYHYYKTVKTIAERCLTEQNEDGISKPINPVSVVTTEDIKNFAESFRLNRTFTNDFNSKLNQLSHLLFIKIGFWSEFDKPEKYGEAIKAANVLRDNLDMYYSNADHGEMSMSDFKNKWIAEINNARPALEKHRGMKQILGNLALAVAGLGVFYVAAGLINLMATGGRNFLFFKTNTAKILDQLENQISPMLQPSS
ncbi:MAG: hypothetical protein Q8M40_03340 [Legionella sp.]|nr:hypothetical protein [Legionella sp.]